MHLPTQLPPTHVEPTIGILSHFIRIRVHLPTAFSHTRKNRIIPLLYYFYENSTCFPSKIPEFPPTALQFTLKKWNHHPATALF